MSSDTYRRDKLRRDLNLCRNIDKTSGCWDYIGNDKDILKDVAAAALDAFEGRVESCSTVCGNVLCFNLEHIVRK